MDYKSTLDGAVLVNFATIVALAPRLLNDDTMNVLTAANLLPANRA